MKITTRQKPLAVVWTALIAAQAAFVMNTSQAQTFQTVTNGLVDYYPLNQVLSGSVTPDLISRRDLSLINMTAANIVAASHSGINSSNTAMNFNQSGGPTLAYYATTGQNPFDGSGDFLPFINQRGATMNFWIKSVVANTSGNELRLMAECANDGQNGPFFSWSTKQTSPYQLQPSLFDRINYSTTDPNGVAVNLMSDGTYQTPVYGANTTIINQPDSYTANNVCDGNWHMLTTEIETNGDVHVFVDGNYDQGGQSRAITDNEGNLAIAGPLNITNTYYNTNIYPNLALLPAGTNSAAGSVRWVLPDLNVAGAKTTFGGYIRNGANTAGMSAQYSDIGFWNRTLTTNELQFIMTNGLNGLALNTNAIIINSFAVGIPEVGQGSTVNLKWNITGVGSTPGSIVISGVGDVSYLGASGSTNITLPANQTYTFTLTAHNGLVANQLATASVQVLQGVSSSWNLIQRFDGVFANTTSGLNGSGWTTLKSTYLGNMDVNNVVTVNGNKALSPKSGFFVNSGGALGYNTTGTASYGQLNNLTIPPYQQNTLFFRFSLTTPPTVYNGTFPLVSGLDCAIGLTDFGFTAPLYGNQPAGQGGCQGPGIHISASDASGAYGLAPYDLQAANYNGTNYAAGYDYLTDAVNGNTNGLTTNVNYYCWLDVSNDNTHAVTDGSTYTNTAQEPRFTFWIQAQGATSRTLLFSNFYGDRNYANNGVNSDNMSPYLNKVFMSVCSQAFQNSDNGAFFGTNNVNCILVDDFYLSANGYNGTIPRLFNLNAISRAANGNVTISWESLGSLFQTNTYSVQRKLNINDASWTTLTTGLPSGGDFTSYTDTSAGANTHAFYRITWP